MELLNSIKSGQFNDPNIKFTVKGITIHNTNSSLSAQSLYELLKESKQTNACHVLIDEKDIIQILDFKTNAWHTGMGYDNGNLYTIAIEICRSQSELSLYLKAQDNAIKYIKQLINEYKLSINDIYFHNDFNAKSYCPHRILDLYKTKKEFIRKEFENGN